MNQYLAPVVLIAGLFVSYPLNAAEKTQPTDTTYEADLKSSGAQSPSDLDRLFMGIIKQQITDLNDAKKDKEASENLKTLARAVPDLFHPITWAHLNELFRKAYPLAQKLRMLNLDPCDARNTLALQEVCALNPGLEDDTFKALRSLYSIIPGITRPTVQKYSWSIMM